MREREALAREAVEELALQRLARREADRMHEDVEAVPAPPEFGEHRFDLRVAGHVQRQHDVGTELARRLVDAVLEPVVLVREGEAGAFAVHRLGDAPGDRAMAGDADDECALALEESHALPLPCRHAVGVR